MKAWEWKIRIIYQIFILFFTLFLGILLIYECADVYYANFSPEYIQKKLKILIFPFAIYIAAVAVDILLCHALPKEDNFHKNTFKGVKIPKKWAEICIKSVCGLFCLGAGIFCVIKLATFSPDGSNANGQVLSLLKSLAPWIGSSFVLCLILPIFNFSTPSAPKSVRFWEDERFIFTLRVIIFALALTLIILGIINGGQSDVHKKAVKICRECIGLG